MIEYQFYFRDAIKGSRFVGKLQEKRKYPNRITYRSLINWGRKLIRDDADMKNLYFIRVKREENNGKTCRTNSFQDIAN